MNMLIQLNNNINKDHPLIPTSILKFLTTKHYSHQLQNLENHNHIHRPIKNQDSRRD